MKFKKMCRLTQKSNIVMGNTTITFSKLTTIDAHATHSTFKSTFQPSTDMEQIPEKIHNVSCKIHINTVTIRIWDTICT